MKQHLQHLFKPKYFQDSPGVDGRCEGAGAERRSACGPSRVDVGVDIVAVTCQRLKQVILSLRKSYEIGPDE